jgi:hypothetical protein
MTLKPHKLLNYDYQMLRMENRIEKQREKVEEKSCFSCILHE